MKKITKLVCLAVLVLVSTFSVRDAIAQNDGNDEQGRILTFTEFTIKGGHDAQFREGVKAWKTCYLEHDGEWTWNMWRRIQGEGIVYGLSSFMDKWAEMDETGEDDAGQACQNLVQSMIVPHVESSVNNMSRTMPEMSKTPVDGTEVVSVFFWRVKNSTKFLETVRSVESALRKEEGEPRGYWYSSIGGDLNAPHYFVVVPYPNFATMDEPMDGVWDVVEKADGKNKRDQLQVDYRESVDQSWSYLYRRLADLSRVN